LTTRIQVLFIALSASLFLGLHFELKQQFDPEQLRESAEQVTMPLRWLGKTAPDFEAEALDGSRFHLADHIGKEIVILNFFATWCGPCRKEIPELIRFSTANAGRSVLLVAIDAAEERPTVQKFVKDFQMNFPVLMDHPGGVRQKYGVRVYPTTVLIGVRGQIELYEASAIANADVTLSPFLTTNRQLLKEGRGIETSAYVSAASRENYRGAVLPQARDDFALTGRAKTISDKMYCLCGCSQRVAECRCKTASNIKKKLKEGGFESQTDEEVIKALGKEFCMGEM
jgi:thiol-disulfide isomerase/thioredoxin